MQTIEIRAAKGLAFTLIVIGALCCALNLAVGAWLGAAVGVMLVGIGVAFLTKPAIIVHPDRVESKNAFGMTVRKTPIHGLGDLRLEDRKLYRVGDGKKIRNLGFGGARPEDLAELGRVIDLARAGRTH